jgi:hypothetical protein
MKLSLVILAFYIGLLSCFPCQDIPVHIADGVTSDKAIVHDNTHSTGEAADFCSPFCSCSCCATVNIPPMTFGYVLPSLLLAIPEKSFEYKASFDQDNAGLIWQPPRLV